MWISWRRNVTTLVAAAACVASACTSFSTALADTPSAEAVAESRRDLAKVKYQLGTEAYREKRFPAAVRLFLEADKLAPSAALSFNIALAYEQEHDERSALRWYRDYLRRDPKVKNAAEVRAKIAAIAASLAASGVQQLSVFSTPAGATVTLNERSVGVTPFTDELSPGKHHLLLQLAGYEDREIEVSLAERSPADVFVRLDAARPHPVAVKEARALPVRAGDQRVDRGRPLGIAPWVVAGTGAASLAAALGFELGRRSEESQAEQAQSQLEFQRRIEDVQTLKTTARVLAGVGGGLVLTGGMLFIFNAKPTPSSQIGVGCGGRGCQLVAKGTFP